VVEEPVVEDETVAEEPVVDEPVVEEPVVEEPVAEETPPATEEVSDTAAEPSAESDAEVSDTGTAPSPVVKPSKSQRHVPRTARRTRTKNVREKAATRKPITRTEKPEYERGRRQERRGIVVSDKADKTIIVKVDVIKSHPKYKKVIRSTVKFHAHDEANTAGVGDTVRIVETRPLSKLKHWRLAEIVEKAR
jgi:small subunit ribosomal protein S17